MYKIKQNIISFWNWYKMMGIIKSLKCCHNLYQVVVCLCPGAFFPWVELDHTYDRIIFFPDASVWVRTLNDLVLYFQVCSNSAYPQHSGERYRTNGPLVVCFGCQCALDQVRQDSDCYWNKLLMLLVINKLNWATSRENVSSGIFDQVRFKPVCSATEAS